LSTGATGVLSDRERDRNTHRMPRPRIAQVRTLPVLVLILATILVVTPCARAYADTLTDADAIALPVRATWPLGGHVELLRGFEEPQGPWGAGHRGVDLAAAVGDPVLAAADGVVSFAGSVAGRGVVVVQHTGPGGGVSRTTYEPVTANAAVGDHVGLGDPIGVLAVDTRPEPHCAATAPCLHWGLLVGDRYLDPLLLLGDDGAADGPIRLLPGDAVDRAEQRALQEAALGVGLGRGPGGEHGFLYPVAGPITSPFGMRLHPILKVWKLHDGTDFGAACGTPLRAAYDGVVVERELSAALGNRLVIDHGVVDGHRVLTALNHAQSYRVAVGDHVRRGEIVGTVGQTGYATGCHLHLMVYLDGALIDPMTWFA